MSSQPTLAPAASPQPSRPGSHLPRPRPRSAGVSPLSVAAASAAAVAPRLRRTYQRSCPEFRPVTLLYAASTAQAATANPMSCGAGPGGRPPGTPRWLKAPFLRHGALALLARGDTLLPRGQAPGPHGPEPPAGSRP